MPRLRAWRICRYAARVMQVTDPFELAKQPCSVCGRSAFASDFGLMRHQLACWRKQAAAPSKPPPPKRSRNVLRPFTSMGIPAPLQMGILCISSSSSFLLSSLQRHQSRRYLRLLSGRRIASTHCDRVSSKQMRWLLSRVTSTCEPHVRWLAQTTRYGKHCCKCLQFL